MVIVDKQKYNLFLDDVRMPGTAFNYMHDPRYNLLDWVIVRNYKEFVETVDKLGIPDLVSYDHDLADVHYDPSTWTESFKYDEETGLDCCKYLISKLDGSPHPKYLVHSWNPVGADNILKTIYDYTKTYGIEQ